MLETKTDLISVTESAMSSSNLSNYFAIILFKVKYETKTGQNVYVLGNTKELGNWQPEKGLKLTTNIKTYPLWFATEEIKCPIGTEINYKYILMNSETNKIIEWESNMSNRLYKVENKGIYEIKEEKGNKKREITILKNNKSRSNITFSNLNPKPIGTISPIQNRNLFHLKDLADNDIIIRGSMCSSDDNNILINTHFSDVLNYDQVRIDEMQKSPLTIALKSQIEINPSEDKFIILTALLPFKIKKNENSDNDNKYIIEPKYEDEFYESLFNIRKENIYDIHWFGMLEDYENFYNNEETFIDNDLIEFLRKEKIYVIKPKLSDYNNYWIYISHILGKICYENKIPINDIYFIE